MPRHEGNTPRLTKAAQRRLGKVRQMAREKEGQKEGTRKPQTRTRLTDLGSIETTS
jgi:hypothetical protein